MISIIREKEEKYIDISKVKHAVSANMGKNSCHTVDEYLGYLQDQ